MQAAKAREAVYYKNAVWVNGKPDSTGKGWGWRQCRGRRAVAPASAGWSERRLRNPCSQ